MNRSEALSIAIQLDKEKPKFNRVAKYKLFPFHTRQPERAKFLNGFDSIIGVIARGSLGYKLDYTKDDFDTARITNDIESIHDEIPSEERDKLVHSIFDYKNLDYLKHPFLINFKTLSEDNSKTGEIDIGEFLIELFKLSDNHLWKAFIGNKEPSNIVEQIILESVNDLKTENIEYKYFPIAEHLFPERIDDLNFLLKHKDFALKNLNNFFVFYYFQYLFQTSIYIDRVNSEDMTDLHEIYYTFDFESITSTRETNKRGYNVIKGIQKRLLVNERLIGYLNELFDSNDILSISQMLTADTEKLVSFNDELMDFLNRYKETTERKDDIPELLIDKIILFKQWIAEDIAQETVSRYYKEIEEIGSKYFLKNRGKLGRTLVLRKEFIILLTAICVKDKKMILKDLFVEFEKRGVFLDRYSKEELVNMYEKMNILDKKSDSGEAKYVKPIL